MNQAAYRLEQTKLTDSKVFRDAVHNYIHVDQPLILDLINSHEMQRLRRIKQLGGTHQVYQSAEHSRFCHSLGVYFIARKMIFNSEVGKYLSDYDKLTVMCAALLHDLGHGPFSHCFEGAFGLNHEEYTVKIINGRIGTRFSQRIFQYQTPPERSHASHANSLRKGTNETGENAENGNHYWMRTPVTTEMD